MKKLFVITLFLLLVVAGMVVVNRAVESAGELADLSYTPKEVTDTDLPFEHGMFAHAGTQLSSDQSEFADFENVTLEEYYSRRAYHGAPPYIPHPVEDEMSIGGRTCLQCHQDGGYVQKFEAFAPVTPHPEKINCRQCHSNTQTEDLFKNTEWDEIKAKPPGMNNQALPGSPPPMPHGVFLRESCLSCHTGPAAPKEIRIDHPERVNCRQCHATNANTDSSAVFSKELK